MAPIGLHLGSMHVADGILPAMACGLAHAAAWPAVYWAGRRAEPGEVARMGLASAALFAVSLVHIPVAGVTIHFGLFGLAGIIAGRRALVVVAAALLLQAFLFQHGGLLSLGVNILNMGAGAVLAGWLWRRVGPGRDWCAFLSGLVGIAVPALLLAAEFEMVGYGKGFWAIAGLYALVGVLEGLATVGAVRFLTRTRPALLGQAGPAISHGVS